MQQNYRKALVPRWNWLLGTLLFVIAVLLTNFLGKSQSKARELAEERLAAVAEDNSGRIKNVIDMLCCGQEPLTYLLKTENDVQESDIQKAIDSLAKTQWAYAAAYCDQEGNGVVSGLGAMDMAEMSYFEQIKVTDSDVFYVEDDGITGQPAVICVSPVWNGQNPGAYVISYLNTKYLETAISLAEIDDSALCLWIGEDGKVLGEYGTEAGFDFISREHFWEEIIEVADKNAKMEMVRYEMQNGISGVFYVQENQNQFALAYASVPEENGCVIIAVPGEYVSRLEQSEWKPTQDMLLRLGIVIFAFLGVVTVLSIVAKVRFYEHSSALEDKADKDLLTDLNNKIATERKIKEYMANKPKGQGVMFLIDIDNFKKINDTLGHSFGDEVLRTLGVRISSEFRASDIIGRIGGDEFMIFLKDLPDDMIEKEGKKVERFFQTFEAGEYVKYSVTASIGGAVFPQDAHNFEDLYAAADRAVYIAKKRGRNQLVFYKTEE